MFYQIKMITSHGQSKDLVIDRQIVKYVDRWRDSQIDRQIIVRQIDT